MVRIRLDDDFYLKDATVFGIVSELPDHRLTFLLNNDLGLKLNRSLIDRELKYKGTLYRFSEFVFEHPVTQMFWSLTSNRGRALDESKGPGLLTTGQTTPLVADLKTFDYFIWYDDVAHKDIEAWLNLQLKMLPYVRAFQKIDLATSKNINNLLLEY